MNRAYAGRPRMQWYWDGQSTTSNSKVSRLKSSGVPKTTSRLIFPMGMIGFPGSTSGFCGREVLERYVHLADGRGEDEVETASAVHKHPAHIESSDLGVEHQRGVSGPWDAGWLIGSLEQDRHLRPVEVLGGRWKVYDGKCNLSSD